MLHFDWYCALHVTTRKGFGKLFPSTFDLSHPSISDTVEGNATPALFATSEQR